MLGWMIYVYKPDAIKPGQMDIASGPSAQRLATWQANISGVRWLQKLVSENCAELVSNGYGYPDIFSAQARWVVPVLLEGPPGARDVWIIGEGDQIDCPVASRRSRFDREAILACNPEDQLVIEVWDES